MKKRLDNEWRRVEEIRVREERRAEREWRWQKAWERRREVNREKVMIEWKCFVCRGFGHIVYYCRNVENRQEGRPIYRFLNRFKVLENRVIDIGEDSGREISKDRKTILREEKLKERKERSVKVRKVKEEKTLREVTVKIELKQEKDEEEIVVEALLDSGATGLVMCLEFVRKNKFRKFKKCG